MVLHSIPDLVPALPELWLAIAGMALLMVGVFSGNRSTQLLIWLSVVAIGSALLLVLYVSQQSSSSITFSEMFIADRFAGFSKCLVLIGSGLALVLSIGYLKTERIERFEYPVLLVLATLGMLMMVSANDLIALYLGLELQSLALYVLAAFRRESLRSTEAGLKYFVLGALSSGMLLYGCSLIYGFTGSTNFTAIASSIVAGQTVGIGLIIGLVFVISGLAFKVSAVPFHMWTPDVYEGAPTPITAFFAIAPKIAALALFLRILVGPFLELAGDWQQVVIVISVASMILGSLAAIWQTNIKRLMAYSSIGHMGFALIGLSTGTVEGVRGVLVYLVIYLAMNVGAFSVVLCMRRDGESVENIEDLSGLSQTNPMLALAMGIFMFSLAGVPPLAGFFAKFYVFMAAINSGLYVIAIIGVLASVVGAFYYVRIVKLMYFDEPRETFEKPIRRELSVTMAVAGGFSLFFFLYPGPIINQAQYAALSLFP